MSTGKASVFTLRELLAARDFRWSVFATVIIVAPVVAASALAWGNQIQWNTEVPDLATLIGSVTGSSFVISGTIIGLTLAAFAILPTVIGPTLLARMYARDEERLDRYLEVLFFPLKLGIVAVAVDLFALSVRALPSQPVAVLIALITAAILFALWEIAALLMAVIQIRDGIVTGARMAAKVATLAERHDEEPRVAIKPPTPDPQPPRSPGGPE